MINKEEAIKKVEAYNKEAFKKYEKTPEEIRQFEKEANEFLNENLEFEIKPKRFKNKETGEIVTQFSILEINKFEEILE